MAHHHHVRLVTGSKPGISPKDREEMIRGPRGELPTLSDTGRIVLFDADSSRGKVLTTRGRHFEFGPDAAKGLKLHNWMLVDIEARNYQNRPGGYVVSMKPARVASAPSISHGLPNRTKETPPATGSGKARKGKIFVQPVHPEAVFAAIHPLPPVSSPNEPRKAERFGSKLEIPKAVMEAAKAREAKNPRSDV